MSVEYTFQIKPAAKCGKELAAINIIERLVKAGWSLFSDNDNIIYTDVGDEDNFDFIARNIGKEDYYDIVYQKQLRGEVIAFAMFYAENHCVYRIDVMITPDFEVIISPDDLTKKMLSYKYALLDVNWYICKILPYLTDDNMVVESFSFCVT